MRSAELFAGHVEFLCNLFYTDPRDAMSYFVFAYRWSVGYPMVQVINHIGGGTMARGSKQPEKQSTQGGSQWTTFVNINLVESDKAEIDRVFGDASVLGDSVARLITDGYRVGLSFDVERDCAIASLTCRDVGSPNAGRTFTSFAQTWPEALAVMCYKHFVKCDTVWPDPHPARSSATFG